MAAKNNQPEWSPAELKFRMTPLAADLRYFLMEKGKLSAFAGAGASVFLVKDDNPIEEIKATIIGFNAMAGGYYQFSKKIFAQLFVKFNMAQKDVYPGFRPGRTAEPGRPGAESRSGHPAVSRFAAAARRFYLFCHDRAGRRRGGRPFLHSREFQPPQLKNNGICFIISL